MTLMRAKINACGLSKVDKKWEKVYDILYEMKSEEFSKLMLDNCILNINDLAEYYGISDFKDKFDIINMKELGYAAFDLSINKYNIDVNSKYVKLVNSSVEKLIKTEDIRELLKRDDEIEDINYFHTYIGRPYIFIHETNINEEEKKLAFYPEKFHTAMFSFKTKRKKINLFVEGILSKSSIVVLENFDENSLVTTVDDVVYVLKERSTELKKTIIKSIVNSEPDFVDYSYIKLSDIEVKRLRK